MPDKPAYKRILVKLSGEALMGEDSYGINQAVIELKLHNVTVVCERVEKYTTSQTFDWVVSRAFAELADFVTQAGRLVAPGGTLLAMKGVNPADEIAQLKEGFKLSGVTPLAVPGLAAERHLVFLQAA